VRPDVRRSLAGCAAPFNWATIFLAGGLILLLTTSLAAQPYSALQDGDIVQLRDDAHQIVLSILPSAGNLAFKMTVKGQDVLRWPFASVEAFKARPALSGLPFLGPWANRLDEQAFYANGKRYPFDMALGNVRGEIPIHGFLSTTSVWKVAEVKSDAASAWATSVLEFYRNPAWMKQWPFAHTVTMTYRLRDGTLDVETAIENLSAEPMPVAVGFHPYFQLTDAPRDAWTIAVAARTRWLLSPAKVPTGETEPIERLFPNPASVPLAQYNLDDVFSDLVRDTNGRATVSVTGRSQRLDVTVGPNYKAMVIYAPQGATTGFICLEPMAGITNAINMAHRGQYGELQTVAPGDTWRERFQIRPTGF
jgi:aldose 1-epimerase